MFVAVFGVLLLVADVRRSCGWLGGVRSDAGGSGGRRVGKGARKARPGRWLMATQVQKRDLKDSLVVR